MNLDVILELTWLPIMVFAICMMYGILLITTKNPKAIESKKNPVPIRDREKYAVKGGQLLLFLAAGAAVNCGLLFLDPVIALIQIITWFIIFAFLWRRMSNAYGPIN